MQESNFATCIKYGLQAVVISAMCAQVASAQCAGDLDSNGSVDAADLSGLLAAWGASGKTAGGADIDADGEVGASDLSLLLGSWGSCDAIVPPWATLIEAQPDPEIVTDPAIRAAIVASGYAWRVRDVQLGIEMLLIPAGSVLMGCPVAVPGCYPDERPQHAIELTSNFYMGRHEVTQSAWITAMGSNPSFFQGPSYPGSLERPVEWVSWSDIQMFLMATSMELPTEAQWEYAYRANTLTVYHGTGSRTGGSDDPSILEEIAWYQGNHGAPGTPTYGTKVVGLKLANGFGLHDMSGNVWEWVRDWHSAGYYAESPVMDPQGPVTGSQRVLRGGGCGYNADSCRGSVRGEVVPSFRHGMIGFRVVRTLFE